ncbi:MarR family winged helix-turn-helix transcriptional regulator [Luteimicrobium sp. DT211]|uniref:MarR family winged helix-turn-helix transcriptional regulator n=1 Tax=Luteimicrobium sp. DT211 TaxID=3393412 RepID=UPI003CF226ED
MTSPTPPASPPERPMPERLDAVVWRPLTLLLRDLDDQIATLYATAGIEGVKPRYSLPLVWLDQDGPLTIRTLADRCDVTHSAMSQTVSAMRDADLVRTVSGPDARTRLVELTEHGRSLVAYLVDEWNATEAAVRELESELPYPLTRVVDDLHAALARRSFRDRIAARMSLTPPEDAGSHDAAASAPDAS